MRLFVVAITVLPALLGLTQATPTPPRRLGLRQVNDSLAAVEPPSSLAALLVTSSPTAPVGLQRVTIRPPEATPTAPPGSSSNTDDLPDVIQVQGQQHAQAAKLEQAALLGSFNVTIIKTSATQSVLHVVDSTSDFANGQPIGHTNQQTQCTINKSAGADKEVQCGSKSWGIFFDTGSPNDPATVHHYVKYKDGSQRKREASQISVFITNQSTVGKVQTEKAIEYATGIPEGVSFDYINADGPNALEEQSFPRK